MNLGRAVAAAVAGLFLFFFVALALGLFGVVPLTRVLVTFLPVVGLVLGAVVGALVPKRGAATPVPTSAAPVNPGVPAPAPGVPVSPQQFVPTHTVPAPGLPTWPAPDAAGPSNGRLDPGLAVRVVGRHGEWAQVHCENGWETWVNGTLLVPVR